LLVYSLPCHLLFFFFFNYPAPTQIFTLSLHDALPISPPLPGSELRSKRCTMASRPLRSHAAGLFHWLIGKRRAISAGDGSDRNRSEEHTSELQSRVDLVCRLLLEKKKKHNTE